MKANDNNNQVIETTLLRGKVKLLQPKVGFHASIDTVFLGAAALIKDRWLVLDVGCGVGSAGLCAWSRNKNISLVGIDFQQQLVDLALQNASLNNAVTHCRFFPGNIKTEKIIADNAFNSVMINPPYHALGTHTTSPKKIKAYSHGEDGSGVILQEWVKYAHRKLKNGGYLTVIHRADRLDHLITSLTHRRWFGSLIIYPLHSHAGEDARRVIIQARKERYAPSILKSGMVVHEADGSYTKDALRILDDGSPLDLRA
jgi:tRNA1(Val) A37 N6-methylase TrmN6